MMIPVDKFTEVYFNDTPAKNILIISDNYILASFFVSELSKNNTRTAPNFDVRFSVTNKSPQYLLELNAKPINLKDDNCVKMILDHYDLVISLHCKQIFPKQLVSNLLCINIHPGFNPINRGWYPQVFSIKNGTTAGATIHVMDEEVDHGAIIDQKQVEIFPSDTSLEVYNRVIELEKALITKNIYNIVNRTFVAKYIDNPGNYNSISDFRSICELNLNSTDTLKNHLNLLRALSHGEYQNAYFIDKNKKYYVRVSISTD